MEKLEFVIFPHAGGGTLYYNKWQRLLCDKYEVTVVQYPMREQKMNQPMPESLEILANNIFEEYKLVLGRKCILWGHSMGSFVAYEVMKRMEDNLGVFPDRFYSSGAAAPCFVQEDLSKKINEKKELYKLLERFGGIAPELLQNQDFKDFFIPVIETDMVLVSRYRDTSRRKVKCPIVLMEGNSDNCDISKWKSYADAGIESIFFEGNHFFMEEHVMEVVEIFKNEGGKNEL